MAKENKDVFQFDAALQFDLETIKGSVEKIKSLIDQSVSEIKIDVKVSDEGEKTLEGLSNSIKKLAEVDSDFSNLQKTLSALDFSKLDPKQVDEVAKGINEIGKGMRAVNTQQGDFKGNLTALSKTLQEFGQTSRAGLSKQLDSVVKAMTELSNTRTAASNVERFAKAITQLKTGLEDVNNLSLDMVQLDKAVSEMTSNITKHLDTEGMKIPVTMDLDVEKIKEARKAIEDANLAKPLKDLGGEFDKLHNNISAATTVVKDFANSVENVLPPTLARTELLTQQFKEMGEVIKLNGNNFGEQAVKVKSFNDILDQGVQIQEKAAEWQRKISEGKMLDSAGEKDMQALQNAFNETMKTVKDGYADIGRLSKDLTQGEITQLKTGFDEAAKSVNKMGEEMLKALQETEKVQREKMAGLGMGQDIDSNTAINALKKELETSKMLSAEKEDQIRKTVKAYEAEYKELEKITAQQEKIKQAIADTPIETKGISQAEDHVKRLREEFEKLWSTREKAESAKDIENANRALEMFQRRLVETMGNLNKSFARGDNVTQIQNMMAELSRDVASKNINAMVQGLDSFDKVLGSAAPNIERFQTAVDAASQAGAENAQKLPAIKETLKEIDSELFKISQTQQQLAKSGNLSDGNKEKLDSYKKQLVDIKDQIKGLESVSTVAERQMKELAANAKEFGDAVQKIDLKGLHEGSFEGVERAINAFTGAQNEIDKVTYSLGEHGQRLYKISGSYTDLEGNVQKTTYEYDSLNKQLIAVSGSTKQVEAEMAQQTSTFDDLGKHISIASIKMRVFYAGMGKIREGIQFTEDMRDEMTQLAIVQGETLEYAKGQFGDLEEASKRLNTSLREVTETQVDLMRQGLDMSDAKDRMETIVKLSHAGRVSMEDSMKAITVGVNTMGESVERTADVLLAASQKSATSVEGLSEGFSVSAASADALGLSIEETTAMIAIMTEKTQLAESQIGNGLKTMLARFNKINAGDIGKDELNQIQNAFENIAGINFTDANGQIRSMYDLVGELADVWDTLDKNQKAAIATEAAGTRMQPMFYAMVEGFEDIKNLTTDLEDTYGTLESAHETWTGSAQAANERLKGSWERMFMAITDSGATIGLKNILSSTIDFITALGPVETILAGIFAVFSTQMKLAEGSTTGLQKGLSDVGLAHKKSGEDGAKAEARRRAEMDKSIAKSRELSASLTSSSGTPQSGGMTKISKEAEDATKKTQELSKAGQEAGTAIETGASQGAMGISKLGETATTVGRTLLIGIKQFAIAWVAMKVVGGIVGAITDKVNEHKEAVKEAERAVIELNDSYMFSKEGQGGAQIKELEEELKVLQKHKDTIGLKAEEQARFTQISNEIGALLPELIAYEDEYGNKVLRRVDSNEQLLELYKQQSLEKSKEITNSMQDGGKGIGAYDDIGAEIAKLQEHYSRMAGEVLENTDVLTQEMRLKVADFFMELPDLTSETGREAMQKLLAEVRVESPEIAEQLEKVLTGYELDTSGKLEEGGRRMANQIFHGVRTELDTVDMTPELENLFQSSLFAQHLSGVIRDAGVTTSSEIAELGRRLSLEFADKFDVDLSGKIVIDNGEVQRQLDALRTETEDYFGLLEDGNITQEEYSEIAQANQLKELEILAEHFGIKEEFIELLREEIAAIQEKNEAEQGSIDAKDQIIAHNKEILELVQDSEEQLQQLNEAYIDLMYAGEEWGVSQEEAMRKMIELYPELLQYYGDHEGMMVAAAKIHEDTAWSYVSDLINMVGARQGFNETQRSAIIDYLRMATEGNTADLNNEAVWAGLKEKISMGLIKNLAGAWAHYYEVQADGSIAMSAEGKKQQAILQKSRDMLHQQHKITAKLAEAAAAQGNSMGAGILADEAGQLYNEYLKAGQELAKMDSIQADLNKGAASAAQQFKNLQTSINLTDWSKPSSMPNALNNIGNSAGKAGKKLDDLGKKANKAAKKAGSGAKKAGNKAKKAGDKGTKAAKENDAALKALNDTIDATKDKLEKVKDAQKALGEAIKETEGAMKELEDQYNEYNKALEWTTNYAIKIIEKRRDAELKALEDVQKKQEELLKTGKDSTSSDPYAVINSDNIEDNIKNINKEFEKLFRDLEKRRAKEDKAIEDAFNERIKAIERERDLKRKALQEEIDALQKLKDIDDYRYNLKKQQENIGKIALKVEDFSLDDSISGMSNKIKAEEELRDAQLEFGKTVADREFQHLIENYNHQMTLLDSEYNIRLEKEQALIEQQRENIRERLEEERRLENERLKEQQEWEIELQNRRLEDLKRRHEAEKQALLDNYTQRKIHEEAAHAIATGNIKDIDGQTRSLYDAITRYRREYEDGWGIFAHKREAETKKYLNLTSKALKELGLDQLNHLKKWEVAQNSTYQKLSKQLDGLKKQNADLSKEAERLNKQIKDAQKKQSDLRNAQRNLNSATAKGIKNNVSAANKGISNVGSGLRKLDTQARNLNNRINNAMQNAKQAQREADRAKQKAEEAKRKAQEQKRIADKLVKSGERGSSGFNQGTGTPTNSISKYADGGVVTHTGPAIVHGSKAAPEYVFNTPQMKALAAMVADNTKARGDFRGIGRQGSGATFNVDSFIRIDGDASPETQRLLQSESQKMLREFENLLTSRGLGRRQ